MMISWIGNCHVRPVNSSLQTENWNCVQHLDKVITFRHACDMVQIQQKNSWAETKCTEIYFQFSFVQISPLPSYWCMHLLLWACLFLWAWTLAIPSFDFSSITKLTRIAERRFLTGLQRGYVFWREGAAIHTQATIKPCRQPLHATESHVRLKHKQSGISLNLRTGPTGHATLFNQWEGALVFINKQIKTSPQWSKLFETTDGVGQN